MNYRKDFSEDKLAIYKNSEAINEEEKHIAIGLSCMLSRAAGKNSIREDDTEVWDFQELKANVYRFLETLNKQQYSVIIKYYGLDGKAPRTFSEIATEFQKSDSRITQIEHKVLRKFRRWDLENEMGLLNSERLDSDCESKKIELLKLSTRPYMALKRKGIYTIEELSELTKADLRKIRNIGKKSIEEILTKLSEIGITIPEK